MRREVVAFLAEYRLDGLRELAEAIYTRSETYMRKAIRAVPNGVYGAEMVLDGIDHDIVLRAAVHVRDGQHPRRLRRHPRRRWSTASTSRRTTASRTASMR